MKQLTIPQMKKKLTGKTLTERRTFADGRVRESKYTVCNIRLVEKFGCYKDTVVEDIDGNVCDISRYHLEQMVLADGYYKWDMGKDLGLIEYTVEGGL